MNQADEKSFIEALDSRDGRVLRVRTARVHHVCAMLNVYPFCASGGHIDPGASYLHITVFPPTHVAEIEIRYWHLCGDCAQAYLTPRLDVEKGRYAGLSTQPRPVAAS